MNNPIGCGFLVAAAEQESQGPCYQKFEFKQIMAFGNQYSPGVDDTIGFAKRTTRSTQWRHWCLYFKVQDLYFGWWLGFRICKFEIKVLGWG